MDAGLPRPSARIEKGARQVKPSAQGLLSVIIPFYNASAYLQNCLEALRRSEHCNYELILVNDGSTDSSAEVAGRFADQVLTFPSPRGPAFARNRGAEVAKGEVLFFIDADVFCYPDTLAKVSEVFASRPDLSAVIGSYDNAPPAANFLSRYKNLTHHFVHQNSSSEASTFWTGCGAVKREVFLKLHGFDESYRMPSIEDIELGYRLREQGYRIALCKHIVVKHAKIWTFRSLLSSDIRDRAIPWTILQLYYRSIINDLNVSWPQRAASIFTCLAVCLGTLSFWNPWFLAAAAALMIPVIGWNYKLYRFYYLQGGAWFCLRAAAMHWFYYVYSMLAFGTGCLQYLARRQRR
jgi:glycosyltransferase involved in cell wall biosynthesis